MKINQSVYFGMVKSCYVGGTESGLREIPLKGRSRISVKVECKRRCKARVLKTLTGPATTREEIEYAYAH